MAIDKNRFNYSNIEIFICGVCLDVAVDPILINECEHYLCRECVPADIKNCPNCGSKFTGKHEMCLALKRVYHNIKLRCVNISCEEVLNIENYAEHEQNCPKGIYVCHQSCGFKIHIFMEDEIQQHNCIDYLMQQTYQLNSKIVLLETVNGDLQEENNELKENVHELEAKVDVLQTNVTANKKRRVRCGLILQKHEKFYRCFTCQIRRMTVICAECFENGNHVDHRFALMESGIDGGSYCDCGDPQTLQGAACSNHQLKSTK